MRSLSILLDVGFVPKVNAGDSVISGQVIATKKGRRKDLEINVCETLNIKPGKAAKFILKKPGDRVKEGELIAAKKGAFGVGGKGIISKVTGTVFKIDEGSGIVYVRVEQLPYGSIRMADGRRDSVQIRLDSARREDEEEDIFSPVDGVVELCDNKKIAIKTDKDAILADKVSGKGVIRAEIILLGKDEVDPDSIGVDPSDINGEIKGKIILGRFFQREAISKSFGIGALGIISQNISDEELEDLKKKNIDTPIFIINEENFEKLVKYNGKKIYADTEKRVIIPYEK